VTGYGLELDDVEHARLRAQAAGVHLTRGDLWRLAGVEAGSDVVDLGCGPAQAFGRPETAAAIARFAASGTHLADAQELPVDVDQAHALGVGEQLLARQSTQSLARRQ